jgi:hypothetical protein
MKRREGLSRTLSSSDKLANFIESYLDWMLTSTLPGTGEPPPFLKTKK